LFVGNKLWSGDVKANGGQALDLRNIRSPIILFASMGDNITPPQQAFNWVLDVYGAPTGSRRAASHRRAAAPGTSATSASSCRARWPEGARADCVGAQDHRAAAAGVYAMAISESPTKGGEVTYEVEFVERRLEDLAAQLNRFERTDEKAFEAVAEVSEFNQRGYELFMQPLVQAMSNEHTAQLTRQFHPLRVQNWAISQLNPWLAWLDPAAQAVKANRRPLDDKHPLRRAEKVGAEMVSASLDHYRAVRDAFTEAGFFSMYANIYSRYLADQEDTAQQPGAKVQVDPRELPIVRNALAAIHDGGYVEALARAAFLLTRRGEPLPLSRLELRQEIATDYAADLPDLPPHQWRRIRGEQEIIAQYEPDRAVEALPLLLHERAERQRFLGLLDKLLADRRVQSAKPTPEQVAMLARIRNVLSDKVQRARHPKPVARRA
jgi:hypothetical protein